MIELKSLTEKLNSQKFPVAYRNIGDGDKGLVVLFTSEKEGLILQFPTFPHRVGKF